MRVSVTQHDIDHGAIGDCALCPLALALARTTGKRWTVGRFWAWLMEPPLTQITLPPEATAWILSFDHGQAVTPFSFDVNIQTERSKS